MKFSVVLYKVALAAEMICMKRIQSSAKLSLESKWNESARLSLNQ